MTKDGAPTYHNTSNQPRDKTFSEERTTAEIRVASRKRGIVQASVRASASKHSDGVQVSRRVSELPSLSSMKFRCTTITLDSSIGES